MISFPDVSQFLIHNFTFKLLSNN